MSCILIQIVQRKHRLVLECCEEWRPISGILFHPSIQIFWDCFFSSFPHIHSNKRRHYITFLTNKSSEFYSAFAVRAALNIFTCPFAILLIIPVIFAVKTKRRLCTKSNNSLACLATTDLTVGLIFQPLTMTNFSLMHIGSRIQTVTCTPINDS